MKIWYEKKMDKKIRDSLFEMVIEKCNIIHLILLSPGFESNEAKKLMFDLAPFIYEKAFVTSWMGTVVENEINEKKREALLMKMKVGVKALDLLKKYRNLFKVNSEFEIAFFDNNVCYFYDTIHEQLFAYNLDVMLKFLLDNYHNRVPMTNEDIIFHFYNIQDGGFTSYKYKQHQWSEKEYINSKIGSNLFEYILKNCNRMELVQVLPEKEEVRAKMLVDKITPYIIKESKTLEWMGKVYLPFGKHKFSINRNVEIVDQTIEEIIKYKKIFSKNSAFDIAFFNNETCYFYANANEQMFVYNVDVMSDFVNENYIQNREKQN